MLPNFLYMVIRAQVPLSSSMLSPTSSVPALLCQPVVEKLTRSNHPMWKAQVLTTLQGAQMAGYLDGSVKAPEEFLPHDKNEDTKRNPEYVQWHAHDQ
jgi:hypothetical protein